MSYENTEALLGDTFEAEMRRRGRWDAYAKGMKSTTDPDAYKADMQRTGAMLDLGFTLDQVNDGVAESHLAGLLGLDKAYKPADFDTAFKGYVGKLAQRDRDKDAMFREVLDQEMNQVPPQKFYTDPKLVGYQQEAKAKIAQIPPTVKLFLQNVNKAATGDGSIMFQDSGDAAAENAGETTSLAKVMEAYTLMDEAEKRMALGLLPNVVGPALDRAPAYEGEFWKEAYLGLQSNRESMAAWIASRAENTAAMLPWNKDKYDDNYRLRMQRERELFAQLRNVREAFRGKRRYSDQGFDWAEFKSMFGSSIGEMSSMIASGPAFLAAAAGDMSLQDMVDNPNADAGVSELRSLTYGYLYRKIEEMQLGHLLPKGMAGGTVKGLISSATKGGMKKFLGRAVKTTLAEMMEEMGQQSIQPIVDRLAKQIDPNVTPQSVEDWVDGIKQLGSPESVAMFLTMSAVGAGVNIGTDAAQSRYFQKQSMSPSILELMGYSKEDAAAIASLPDAGARYSYMKEAQEKGRVDPKREVDPDTRVQAHKDARRIAGEESTADQFTPLWTPMPDGTIRVDMPDGTNVTVAEPAQALAASRNWIESNVTQRTDAAKAMFQLAKEFGGVMAALAEAEKQRIGQAHGASMSVRSSQALGLLDAVKAGILTMKQAINRVRDFAFQEAERTGGDPEVMAAEMVEAFTSGRKRFVIQGTASANARIENGFLRASIEVADGADITVFWEEALEAHMHAMLNGGYLTEGELLKMLRNVEATTGKKFLAGEDRKALIEGFSYVGKAYAAGDIDAARFTGPVRQLLDKLLDILMQIVGMAREIKQLRDSGQLDPRLEANIRAGLGADERALYKSLVAQEANKQGATHPQPAANTHAIVEMEAMVRMAQAMELKRTDKKEFFGKIWPAIARKVGNPMKLTSANAVKAAKQALSDMADFIRENPKFLGYYSSDWNASLSLIKGRYPSFQDDDIWLYRFMSGACSPDTKLRDNTGEALRIIHYLQFGEKIEDLIGVLPSTKSSGMVVDESKKANPGNKTAPSKIRSILAAFQMKEKHGFTWKQYRDYLGEFITMDELIAERRELGFKDAPGDLSTKVIASMLEAAGQKLTYREVPKKRGKGTQQALLFPRVLSFGPKVGPYIANNLGYDYLTTVDIWESRLIRTYFDTGENSDLPASVYEREVFGHFSKSFQKAWKKEYGTEMDAASLQALRWYYMIDVMRRAGWDVGKTDRTISEYTQEHLGTFYTEFEGSKTGKVDANVAPVSEGVTTSIYEVMSAEKLQAVADANPDGFTLDPRTGKLVTTGYVVAPSKATETILVAGKTMADFRQAHLPVLSQDQEAYVGGWKRPDGAFVMDVATTYPTAEEAVSVAVGANQDAIFHLDTFTEIKRESYDDYDWRSAEPARKAVAEDYTLSIIEPNFQATPTREGGFTTKGLKRNEIAHYLGTTSPAGVDRIKVQVAGKKGEEQDTYRDYKVIYCKRAYIALNGYSEVGNFGIDPTKGYRIPVHPSWWYDLEADPLNLEEEAWAIVRGQLPYTVNRRKVKRHAFMDWKAMREIRAHLVRDRGFLGYLDKDARAGVILQDLPVDGGQFATPRPKSSLVGDRPVTKRRTRKEIADEMDAALAAGNQKRAFELADELHSFSMSIHRIADQGAPATLPGSVLRASIADFASAGTYELELAAMGAMDGMDGGQPDKSGAEASITPAQDAEYLELAKEPEKNRSRLQEMVDAAARNSSSVVDLGAVERKVNQAEDFLRSMLDDEMQRHGISRIDESKFVGLEPYAPYEEGDGIDDSMLDQLSVREYLADKHLSPLEWHAYFTRQLDRTSRLLDWLASDQAVQINEIDGTLSTLAELALDLDPSGEGIGAPPSVRRRSGKPSDVDVKQAGEQADWIDTAIRFFKGLDKTYSAFRKAQSTAATSINVYTHQSLKPGEFILFEPVYSVEAQDAGLTYDLASEPRLYKYEAGSGVNDTEIVWRFWNKRNEAKSALSTDSEFKSARDGYRNLKQQMRNASYTVDSISEGARSDLPPVTYDSQGNVIPLSQRFNPESPSILYAAPMKPSGAEEPTPERQDVTLALEAVFNRSYDSAKQQAFRTRLYRSYEGTRKALASEFGDNITVWRWKFPNENTHGMATLPTFLSQAAGLQWEEQMQGKRAYLVKHEVPVSDVVCVIADVHGTREQVVILNTASRSLALPDTLFDPNKTSTLSIQDDADPYIITMDQHFRQGDPRRKAQVIRYYRDRAAIEAEIDFKELRVTWITSGEMNRGETMLRELAARFPDRELHVKGAIPEAVGFYEKMLKRGVIKSYTKWVDALTGDDGVRIEAEQAERQNDSYFAMLRRTSGGTTSIAEKGNGTGNGKPLTMKLYRGERGGTGRGYGLPMWTANREHAEFFGTVTEQEFTFRNPLVIHQNDLEDAMPDEDEDMLAEEMIPTFLAKARNGGHDALVIRAFWDIGQTNDVAIPIPAGWAGTLSIAEDFQPQRTVKAYKLFATRKSHPGKLFPLFMDVKTEVPVGVWLRAEIHEGKIGGRPLAQRPGWHAGDIPSAPHLMKRDGTYGDRVWAEVEMPADIDWQSEANRRATMKKDGTINSRTAEIKDQPPYGGHYRYKTNPNMVGEWLISGEMKVTRILSQDEIERLTGTMAISLENRALRDLVAENLVQSSGFTEEVWGRMLDRIDRLEARLNNQVIYGKEDDGSGEFEQFQDIAMYEAMLGALPAEVRAKLGGFATLASLDSQAARTRFLRDKLPKMEAYLDKFVADEMRPEIGRMLAQRKPKKNAAGVVEGKGAEFEAEMAAIREVIGMTPDEVAGEQDRLEQALTVAQDADQINSLTEAMIRLQTFGNVAQTGRHRRHGRDMTTARDALRSLIGRGMTTYRFIQEAKREHNRKLCEMALDVITGGEGLSDSRETKLAEDPTIGKKGFRKWLAERQVDGKGARGFHLKNQSWEWLINAAARRGKEGTLKSRLHRWASVLVHKATHVERRRNMVEADQMSRKLASVFKVPTSRPDWRFILNRKLADFATESSETGVFRVEMKPTKDIKVPVEIARKIVDGEVRPEVHGLTRYDIETLESLLEAEDAKPEGRRRSELSIQHRTIGGRVQQVLSQDQALYLSMLYRQDGAQQAMQRWGYDYTVMKQIEGFLTDEAKQLRTWLAAKYDANYHELNVVYRRVFGIDMARIKNYSPARWRHQGRQVSDNLLEETIKGASTTPGFAKQRINHRAEPRQDVGALQLFNEHLATSSHFIAWAEPMQELRAVFNDKYVQAGLEEAGGKELRSLIHEKLDQFAGGGNQKAFAMRKIDALRRTFTIAALSYNVGVMVKQFTSLPAFLYDMSVRDYARYQSQFFLNPVKNWTEMWNNEFIRERFKGGYERDVMAVMHRMDKTKSRIRWAVEGGMIFGRFGDLVPVVVGGWAIRQSTIDKALKRGATQADAEAEGQLAMEMSVERAQQSGDVKDQSHYQSAGSVNRLFTMFLTSPRQFYSNTYEALLDWRAGTPGAGKDFLKRLVVGHILLPFAFQIVSDIFCNIRNLTDDDDETGLFDLNPADYVRAFLMGPLNGLFLVGHMLTTGFGYATNALVGVVNRSLPEDQQLEETKVWGYNLPIVEWFEDFGADSQDLTEATSELIEDPSLRGVGTIVHELGSMLKVAGGGWMAYDIGNRFLRQAGFTDEIEAALTPAGEKAVDAVKRARKDIYEAEEDGEIRHERLTEALIQATQGLSDQEILDNLGPRVRKEIPISVWEGAFPHLDVPEKPE